MGRTSLTPRQFFRVLHALADRNVGAMEAAFLQSIKVSMAEVNTQALADAIARQDFQATMLALHINGQLTARLRSSLAKRIQRVFLQAAIASQKVQQPSGNLHFNIVNRMAISYARNEAAKLVKQIDEQSKSNIRRIVSRAFKVGYPIPEQSKLIREVLVKAATETMGLTDRQFGWVENLRERLSNKGEPPEVIEKRATKYADKLLRLRATTVARTETIRSANNGQQAHWKAAAERGLIDMQTTRRRYLVAKDDRLCPICRAIPGMNPDGVRLDEPFRAPVTKSNPSGLIMNPGDAHPNCRCTQRIFAVEVQSDTPLMAA